MSGTRGKPRVLRPTRTKHGRGRVPYAVVGLRREGRTCNKFVHTLVLLAFVGPCPEGMECRHLDGSGLNNRLDNLRWGTHKENGEDMRRHGTQRRKRGDRNAKLDNQKVRMIRRLFREGSEQKEIAARYGITQQTVSNVCAGKTWQHIDGPTTAGRRGHWWNAKLDADKVREIRRRCEAGEDQRSVAADFGVMQQTVSRIVTRKFWRHVN